jgi:hypothetical protein
VGHCSLDKLSHDAERQIGLKRHALRVESCKASLVTKPLGDLHKCRFADSRGPFDHDDFSVACPRKIETAAKC